MLDYAGLRLALKTRRAELRLSQLELDDLAGLQGGYVGKLECGDRHFGDKSLGAVLGALGVTMLLMRTRCQHTGKGLEALGPTAHAVKEKIKIARAKAGRKSADMASPAKRKARARKAAKKRWARKERKKAHESACIVATILTGVDLLAK